MLGSVESLRAADDASHGTCCRATTVATVMADQTVRSMSWQKVIITCRSVPMSRSRPCRSSFGLQAVLNRRPFASRSRSAPRSGRSKPVSARQARGPREG